MTDFLPTLGERLAAVAADVAYLQKTGKNEAQGYNFLSEAHVKEKVNAALRQHGLYLDRVEFKLEESKVEYGQDGKARAFAAVSVSVTVAGVGIVDRGPDYIARTSGLGFGGDKGGSADKAVYKAQAGALKYALTSLFLIATGDDPEETTDDDRDDKAPKPKSEPAAEPEPKPEPAVKPGTEGTVSTNALLKAHRIMEEATTLAALEDAVEALAELSGKMLPADKAQAKQDFAARKAQLQPKEKTK